MEESRADARWRRAEPTRGGGERSQRAAERGSFATRLLYAPLLRTFAADARNENPPRPPSLPRGCQQAGREERQAGKTPARRTLGKPSQQTANPKRRNLAHSRAQEDSPEAAIQAGSLMQSD